MLPIDQIATRVLKRTDPMGPIPAHAIHLGRCWVWLGYKSHEGYGRIGCGERNKLMLTHRVMYQQAYGNLDQSLTIDHLCKNPSCCNPQHLEQVTAAENTRRGPGSVTQCKRGHPLSGENLRVNTLLNGRTMRQCKECHRMHCQLYRDREKKAANATAANV